MPGSIQSIERAAAVLQLLARGHGPLGVGEIAASLSLPKGTTHGILSTLRAVGFIDQDAATGAAFGFTASADLVEASVRQEPVDGPDQVVRVDDRPALDVGTCSEDFLGIGRGRPCPTAEDRAQTDRHHGSSDEGRTSS